MPLTTDLAKRKLQEEVAKIINNLTIMAKNPAISPLQLTTAMAAAIQPLNKLIEDQMALIEQSFGQQRVVVPGMAASAPLPAATGPIGRADDAETDKPECCGKEMKYDDGRDAYVCKSCGYAGPNSSKQSRPNFWRRNKDYGEK